MTESNTLPRKYRVVAPKSYSAAPLPGKAEQTGAPLERATERFAKSTAREQAAGPAAAKTRAVWIVHGMGQQVPFETVDGLAEGIMRVAQPVPGRDGFEPRVRTVQIGEQTVQRVELDVFENGKCVELHLYEAYWAPVTEGEIKLSEVIVFLWSASFRGLLNAVKPFHRAMFNQFVKMKIRKWAAVEIGAALLTLLALIATNAVIIAAGGSAYGLSTAGFGTQSFSHLRTNWVALSAVANWLSAVGIGFGLILFVAQLSHPAQGAKAIAGAFGRNTRLVGAIERWSKYIICGVGWIAFALTLITIVGGAVLLALVASGWLDCLAKCRILPQVQALSTLLVAAMGMLAAIVLSRKAFLRSDGRTAWEEIPYIPLFLVSAGLFLFAFFGPLVLRFGWLPSNAMSRVAHSWIGRPFWVWPLLLTVSWMVRTLMVQYVGDVAAYVTAQTLDRFNQIR
jgi:hypothetical protein